MTPSEREEIEKEAHEIAKNVVTKYSSVRDSLTVDDQNLLIDEIESSILTQVAKARAEERESIAVYLEGTETWEGREFAKTIRNKLEKE